MPKQPKGPAELVSQSEFGRRMDVSHTAVQHAIRDGRLAKSVHRHPSGRFKGLDAELALEEWTRNTDPSGQRKKGSRRGGKGGKRPKARKPAKKDQPSLPGFPDVPVPDGPKKADELENGDAAAAASLPGFRAELVRIQAQAAALDLKAKAGRLVDARSLREEARRTWATVRQSLENLADTVSPELALLEGDGREIRKRLRAAIRDELARLADAAERGDRGGA